MRHAIIGVLGTLAAIMIIALASVPLNAVPAAPSAQTTPSRRSTTSTKESVPRTSTEVEKGITASAPLPLVASPCTDTKMLTTRPAELLRTQPSLTPAASNFRRLGCDRSAPTVPALSAGPRSGDDRELFNGIRRQPDVHFNPVGDIVACDGVGEVVLLPHLWNFDLLTVGNSIVLRASSSDLEDGKSGDGNSGMTAVLGFEHGLAYVEVVSETSRGDNGLAAAS